MTNILFVCCLLAKSYIHQRTDVSVIIWRILSPKSSSQKEDQVVPMCKANRNY
jgi:hypothetical protein